LLTILLVVVILAAVLAAIYWGRKLPSWRSIRALAIAQILGIIGQIVLGGITVLTKLNPFAVSSHFLLSIVLIAASLALREEMLGRETVALAPIPRAMARAILGICAFVLMIGTVVTGSGPHAGDIHAKRYHIDPRLISWMHADAVIALISLTIGLYLIVRVSESLEIRSFMEPKILTFLGLCLGQGVIGYVQYFTHLPEALVAAHLLGAATIWLAAWNIANAASLFTRSKKTAS
jgi:cytochrome c oxidase assembly protein subunit 15